MSLANIWFVRVRQCATWIAPLRREPLDLLKMRLIHSHPCCWDDKPVELGRHIMLNNLPSKLIHTFGNVFA
jgi:hypothetical protein